MPIVDGHMATSMIVNWEKENNASHTPVIAVTAHAFEYEIIDAVKSGMDDLVTKPLKKNILLDKVAKFLASSSTGTTASAAGSKGNQQQQSKDNAKKPPIGTPSPRVLSQQQQQQPPLSRKTSSTVIHNPSQLYQSHRFDGSSEDDNADYDNTGSSIQ